MVRSLEVELVRRQGERLAHGLDGARGLHAVGPADAVLDDVAGQPGALREVLGVEGPAEDAGRSRGDADQELVDEVDVSGERITLLERLRHEQGAVAVVERELPEVAGQHQ